MSDLIGHVSCRRDGPLTEAVWKEAEARAVQMLERTVAKRGSWGTHELRRVHDTHDHYVRVTMNYQPQRYA